jgi:hypothetical protein
MDTIDIWRRCVLLDKPYSPQLRLYSKVYLESVINELVSMEEYEKCIDLENFIKVRFV